MLELVAELEAKLTPKERDDREEPLARLRRLIHDAALAGGVDAPCFKSYVKKGSRDVRIDLEVIKGRACVLGTVAS